MTTPSVRPVLQSNRVRSLKIPRNAVALLIHTLDARVREWEIPPGELSIAFLGPRAIARLHGTFLCDSSPTDVITFPGSVEDDLAGEICVSPHMARQAARSARHGFAEELTLYIVHGWLHLAGLDDGTPEARRTMRAAETRCLALLRHDSAVPGFQWSTGWQAVEKRGRS